MHNGGQGSLTRAVSESFLLGSLPGCVRRTAVCAERMNTQRQLFEITRNTVILWRVPRVDTSAPHGKGKAVCREQREGKKGWEDGAARYSAGGYRA